MSHVATTIVVGAIGLFLRHLPVSRWAVLLLAGAFVIGAVGCLFPPRLELTVDETGLAWGRAGRAKDLWLPWVRIRSVRWVRGELQVVRPTGAVLAVPDCFLKSSGRRKAFFAAVNRFGPATVPGGRLKKSSRTMQPTRSSGG